MNDMFDYSPKSHGIQRRLRYRSQLNPQQVAELRRVKKQNAERTRRARISDKIARLHDLALSMVGQDARGRVRMERAEMLNFCYEVLSGLRNLLEENPEVKARLQAIHNDVNKATTTVCQNPDPFPNPSSASTSAIAPSSGSTFYVPPSQATSCDSGVHELHVSTSTSIMQSSSVENISIGPIDCSVQPKKSKEIWRPYLHCL
ncbi:unnamed protein product [Taenia asiatica]|uniref:BHLH domain-containing protein n=1 Tax=Taenia asiatica TaxID=60517 RepID=A0A0R3VVT7_TAEAS|nr:unnamed protein product [Taenia asiatica]